MKRYSSNKDWNFCIRRLVKLGWSYKRRGKHGCVRPPDGSRSLFVPCTPSDRRALKNFKSLVGAVDW
jgi:hypothetical protein